MRRAEAPGIRRGPTRKIPQWRLGLHLLDPVPEAILPDKALHSEGRELTSPARIIALELACQRYHSSADARWMTNV